MAATGIPGNNNMTVSGFAKNEVYQNILDVMHQKNYERMCYLIAELACTPKEVKPLTFFLLDEFVQHRLSSQLCVLEKVSEYVNVLQGFSPKNTHLNPGFQRVMAGFSMLIAVSKPRNDGSPLFRPRVSREEVDAIARRLVSSTLALPSNTQAVLNHSPSPVLGVLASLLHTSKLGPALTVASHLISVDPTAMPDVNFHEMREVKNKKDMVWHVWRLLVAVSDEMGDVRSFVMSALRLYTRTSATRSARLTRINLLMYSIVVICNRAVKTKPVPMAMLQHVADRIHIVYEDTLGQKSEAAAMSYLEYVPTSPGSAQHRA